MSAEPHFFTLTGNLLAERTLEFETWAPGRTQRAFRESFQVGGKGINVAKMLTRLGAPNTALAFAGGATGFECEEWIRRRGLHARTFRTSTATRAGTVIRAPGRPETTFLGPDAAPDAAAVQACAEFLDAQPAGAVLALCGSFPGWPAADFDPLRAALARWSERGPLVADTYGPPLAWLAERSLALLKVNAEEFRPLAATETAGTGAAQAVIVTDGPRAIRWRGSDRAWRSRQPPSVVEISPTGSGDVLLACVLVAHWRRRLTLDQAVEWALPYVAANAAHPGIAEFDEPAQT